jgi:hypothetical protein
MGSCVFLKSTKTNMKILAIDAFHKAIITTPGRHLLGVIPNILYALNESRQFKLFTYWCYNILLHMYKK